MVTKTSDITDPVAVYFSIFPGTDPVYSFWKIKPGKSPVIFNKYITSPGTKRA
ncbi:unnamed protein product, partial [marine sediment metagenome]